MNILHKNILLISILLFTACTSTTKKERDLTFNKIYTLEHKAYDDTELLIRGGRIAILDTFLIIISSDQDPICRVYSTTDNMKELYGYGHIGNGPGEFLQPRLTYSYNNTFGLNEINKQELAIMELTNTNNSLSIIEKARLKAPYKMRKEELVSPDFNFIRLDDTHYVSLLLDGKDRFFSLLDSTLMQINRFGESPIEEDLSNIAIFDRLKGKIAACNGTMAFATTYLPYIACYKRENDVMQKCWSFYYDKPHYAVKNDDVLFDKDKTFGEALNLKMDTKYIYLLYLDQLLSEYDSEKIEKSNANKILVFDYKGNAVAKLQLSCRISNMAITDDQTKIYAIAYLPEPTIVEFDLPKELYKN